MVQKSGDQVGSLSHYLQGLYIPFYCLGFLPSTVWTSKTSASSGNKGMLQIRRANPWEECARLWAAKPQCWAQKFRSTVMLRTWWYTRGSHSCWFVHRSIRTNCLANWQMNKKNQEQTCSFLIHELHVTFCWGEITHKKSWWEFHAILLFLHPYSIGLWLISFKLVGTSS